MDNILIIRTKTQGNIEMAARHGSSTEIRDADMVIVVGDDEAKIIKDRHGVERNVRVIG